MDMVEHIRELLSTTSLEEDGEMEGITDGLMEEREEEETDVKAAREGGRERGPIDNKSEDEGGVAMDTR